MTKQIFTVAAAALLLVSCGTQRKSAPVSSSFPVINQNGKIAVVAHRGFWKSEQGGMSENSIASLKAAQDAGLWGSECDIHLTADGKIIVNHNNDIEGKKISTHNFADFEKDLLPNGERRPSFDEYLVQAAKSRKTKLIVEFKKQGSEEAEARLVDEAFKAIKAHKLLDPSRVLFISFSRFMCEKIAKEYPEFINQFLTSDLVADENPANYAALGINGIDYQYKLFKMHPEWVKQAHELGMSVNVWTVNKPEQMQKMIDLGVDAITTNEPLVVRGLLGDKEFKL